MIGSCCSRSRVPLPTAPSFTSSCPAFCVSRRGYRAVPAQGNMLGRSGDCTSGSWIYSSVRFIIHVLQPPRVWISQGFLCFLGISKVNWATLYFEDKLKYQHHGGLLGLGRPVSASSNGVFRDRPRRPKVHRVSCRKTSQLMLYREIIAVCSQIHTKHINTLCGQNVELYIKTQSVPRSKHTPSQLYKPVS